MNLVFVCTGNICRSPMAEGMFKKLLEEKGESGIDCSSAGLATFDGRPASDNAQAVALEYGVDISEHKSRMLTRSIAVDHAAVGVRAMSICPGTTMTPLVRAAIDSADDPAEHERMLASSRPLNRLGRVEEIAATVEFVLRDEVGYMTGSELVIDGGYTAR